MLFSNVITMISHISLSHRLWLYYKSLSRGLRCKRFRVQSCYIRPRNINRCFPSDKFSWIDFLSGFGPRTSYTVVHVSNHCTTAIGLQSNLFNQLFYPQTEKIWFTIHLLIARKGNNCLQQHTDNDDNIFEWFNTIRNTSDIDSV